MVGQSSKEGLGASLHPFCIASAIDYIPFDFNLGVDIDHVSLNVKAFFIITMATNSLKCVPFQGTAPLPQMSMFCAQSQNNRHFLEK